MTMGLYDTLIARAKCPDCGFEAERAFQTKVLEQSLRTYRIGDRVESDYFLIKDVVIKNCVGHCEKCGETFYAQFSAKDGRLRALIAVNKQET